MQQLVKLKCGSAEVFLCPQVGGAIVSWCVSGQEILRRADDSAIASADPLRFASFPLVPFSNRIANGNFDWDGVQMAIEPNFAPEPHAIHGVGWKAPWEISEQADAQTVLTYRHQADSRWPWPFAATQIYTLGEHSLTIALEAVNLSYAPTPLAFGHHPYFDQQNAYFSFEAEQVFMNDDIGLPTFSERPKGAFDFAKGEQVQGHDIDHCYAGWKGEARIIWKDRPLGLRITSDMPAAVLYIPMDGDAFCFEPVPHINNALNRRDDAPTMPVIQPGGSYQSVITFTAIAAEQI